MNAIAYGSDLTAITAREPSPAIWTDCPWISTRGRKLSGGLSMWDDFDEFPLIGTQTTQIAHGKYKVFATAGSVLPISAVNSVEMPGAILQFGGAANNDSVSLAQSYPSVMLSGLKANSGRLWFECRLALSTLLVDTVGFFIGLAEVEQWTLATGVPFNGGDAITNSASAIGFRKGEDALGVVDTVYSDRATSFTNIGASEATISAANTFIKLGFTYDPGRSADCVRFYSNNLMLATKLSKTTLIGLTNLDANSLGLICSLIADTAGTTAKLYLDWWALAQELPTV